MKRKSPGIDLIEKPFRRETLATRIREILDHRARAEARPLAEPAAEM